MKNSELVSEINKLKSDIDDLQIFRKNVMGWFIEQGKINKDIINLLKSDNK